jgi:hypothetical protein
METALKQIVIVIIGVYIAMHIHLHLHGEKRGGKGHKCYDEDGYDEFDPSINQH